MNRHDVDRIIEAKYRDYVDQVIARLKGLPGDVWAHFATDIQRGHSFLFEEANRLVEQICMEAVHSCSLAELELLWFGSDGFWNHDEDKQSGNAEWKEGVLRELHQRVTNAAGDADLDEDDEGDDESGAFQFNDEDLVFLSEVGKTLSRLTSRPGLVPEEGKAVRRAVAALQNFPVLTPEVNVQIEVAHRAGADGFSESCSCTINLDREQIEISSSGSQSDPAVGSDSYGLESFLWYANGGSDRKGSTETWLERLAYALTCQNTIYVSDESDDGCPEAA